MSRALESRPEFYNFIMTDTSLDLGSAQNFELPPLLPSQAAPKITYWSFAPNNAAQEFIRVFNVKKFFSESCATARITPQQYRQAQELGLTLHYDEALTAKIIGFFGQYRLKVLQAQEELGIRTTLFAEKELLCQQAIQRIRLLQPIERMHGASPSELVLAIENYKNQLAEEVTRLKELPAAGVEKTKTHGSELKALQIKALENDWRQADHLLSQIDKKAEATDEGCNATRDPVAHFIKERINAILASARDTNEILTLASASSSQTDKNGSFFRGFFHSVLSKAWLLNRNKLWDQQHAILATHQGDYSRGASHITVHSTQLLGRGKSALKEFLFGMNLILLNPSYDPFQKDAPSGVKIYSNRSHTSWLFRLLSYVRGVRRGTETHSLPIDTYYKMLEQTGEVRQNIFITLIDDARHALYSFASWIVRTLEVSALNFVAILKEIAGDFRWNPQLKKVPSPARRGASVLEAHEEIVRAQLELFAWLRLPIDQQASETLFEKLNIPHAEIPYNPAEFSYLKNIRSIVSKMTETAPMAQPLYHLQTYNPGDVISKLMDGLESFYNFFAIYYETCPSVALYSSAVYLLSAAAIVNPALISQISSTLNFINTWSSVTAQAMSKSVHSQMIAAGFSGFKEVLLSLQLATDGADSTLAYAIEYIRAHLPQVVLGGATLIGAGFGLSSLGEIPVIGSESGNVKGLEETFIAAKAGAIAYEGLHSEHREASIAARTIITALRIPALLLRLLLSPINALHKLIADKVMSKLKEACNLPPNWMQVAKPWFDLSKMSVASVLTFFDISLRFLNILGMACKLIPKLLTDWLINNSATALNHFQVILGAALGISSAFFLLPHSTIISLLAIGFASAMLTQVIFWTLGLNLEFSFVSKQLLQTKHRLFNFFDSINRPIKQLYESMRNQIARWMMSEWISGEKARATYQLIKLSPNQVKHNPDEVVLTLGEPARARADSRTGAASMPGGSSAANSASLSLFGSLPSGVKKAVGVPSSAHSATPAVSR